MLVSFITNSAEKRQLLTARHTANYPAVVSLPTMPKEMTIKAM